MTNLELMCRCTADDPPPAAASRSSPPRSRRGSTRAKPLQTSRTCCSRAGPLRPLSPASPSKTLPFARSRASSASRPRPLAQRTRSPRTRGRSPTALTRSWKDMRSITPVCWWLHVCEIRVLSACAGPECMGSVEHGLAVAYRPVEWHRESASARTNFFRKMSRALVESSSKLLGSTCLMSSRTVSSSSSRSLNEPRRLKIFENGRHGMNRPFSAHLPFLISSLLTIARSF
mmetsp:Transcript_33196/g.69532  ORF Transcript_33196/g.69532 Transcript_33196/m.69532 type:complete len:231 (+) Transcript_33196:153-845(+)